MVNYVYPKQHHQYILPDVKGKKYHFLEARRSAYEDAIYRWLKAPIGTSNYKDEWDYYDDEYDDEYYYDTRLYDVNEAFLDNKDELKEYVESDTITQTNEEVIDSIIDDVIYVLTNKGFTINNYNLFKEYMTYFIYRLSNIQHVA